VTEIVRWCEAQHSLIWNREIALRLKVKKHSVRNYIYRIFEKLGVSSRVELMLYMFSQRNTSN
jgi:DNA-binding CsgD family transcriptional regulator